MALFSCGIEWALHFRGYGSEEGQNLITYLFVTQTARKRASFGALSPLPPS